MALDARIEATVERLRLSIARHRPAVFTTSLGAEDMVVLDLIVRHELVAEIVTLDTGRLPEETHALLDAARERYGRSIRTLHPQPEALTAFVAVHGSNAFYRSPELRRRCCEIRKLEPLARALAGHRLWITGLRRGQGPARADLPVLAADPQHGVMKLAPLVDWSADDVWAYVGRHDVPVSALHARGYPSIGCAPCTRAIRPGEPERAGRWWWEADSARECGLHLGPDGRLRRAATGTPSPAAAADLR